MSPIHFSWLGGLNCDSAKVVRKPRLLSDNGSSYISSDLAEWLKDRGIAHVRGAPCHPQTQAKIERWHQTLKNRILLENYYLPGDLEAQIARFVEHYNYTPIVLLARPAAQVWGPVRSSRPTKCRSPRKAIRQRLLWGCCERLGRPKPIQSVSGLRARPEVV